MYITSVLDAFSGLFPDSFSPLSFLKIINILNFAFISFTCFCCLVSLFSFFGHAPVACGILVP